MDYSTSSKSRTFNQLCSNKHVIVYLLNQTKGEEWQNGQYVKLDDYKQVASYEIKSHEKSQKYGIKSSIRHFHLEYKQFGNKKEKLWILVRNALKERKCIVEARSYLDA